MGTLIATLLIALLFGWQRTRATGAFPIHPAAQRAMSTSAKQRRVFVRS